MRLFCLGYNMGSKNDIILTATFGDETKEIRLTAPSGANGIYHIMIDNYYYGSVSPDLHNGWRVNLQHDNVPEWMSEDDKEAIVEAVKKENIT